MLRNIARLLALAFALCAASLAHAQGTLFRAYLSFTGNDANPCTLPAPCRLLPAALNAVADGGEVWMLDSANYNTGQVAINKNVSILAVPGVVGSIVATPGVSVISIATTGLKVAFRNLVFTTIPGTAIPLGIEAGTGPVVVEGCVFAGLTTGINIGPGALVQVSNSTFRNNTTGVQVSNGGQASVTGSRFYGNTVGAAADANATAAPSRLTVTESTFSGNGTAVRAISSPFTSSHAHVIRSSIENSTSAGILVFDNGAGATATLNASRLVRNSGAGFSIQGGTAAIRSFGNNEVSDNGANTGSLSAASLQ